LGTKILAASTLMNYLLTKGQDYMKDHWREIVIVLVIVCSFLLMMSFKPISQDLSYHDFADKRIFLGIPNFLDVATNIAFAVFGIFGFRFSLRNIQKEAPWSWPVFFMGVSLVCLGSGYYHLNPSNQTLVWDRLPMTIAFMGLFIGLLSEYIRQGLEKLFLVPAVVLGLTSVVYWHFNDDLRFYFWIQLIPVLIIPFIVIVCRRKYSHQRYLLIALAFYLLAKITELYDNEIFLLSFQQISGHSLKHLFAALSPFSLFLMLKKRKAA
jgi:hypothetical protein